MVNDYAMVCDVTVCDLWCFSSVAFMDRISAVVLSVLYVPCSTEATVMVVMIQKIIAVLYAVVILIVAHTRPDLSQ